MRGWDCQGEKKSKMRRRRLRKGQEMVHLEDYEFPSWVHGQGGRPLYSVSMEPDLPSGVHLTQQKVG